MKTEPFTHLVRAAYSISNALHAMEKRGIRLPLQLDEAWEELTVALEEIREWLKTPLGY